MTEYDVNGYPVDPNEKCCPECDPSPEPAVKTELTTEELAELRKHGWGHWLRLLDEHAAMRLELERLRDDKASLWNVVAGHENTITAERSRIADLESALALATEAVAAEARAKVEGLR